MLLAQGLGLDRVGRAARAGPQADRREDHQPRARQPPPPPAAAEDEPGPAGGEDREREARRLGAGENWTPVRVMAYWPYSLLLLV